MSQEQESPTKCGPSFRPDAADKEVRDEILDFRFPAGVGLLCSCPMFAGHEPTVIPW